MKINNNAQKYINNRYKKYFLNPVMTPSDFSCFSNRLFSCGISIIDI